MQRLSILSLGLLFPSLIAAKPVVKERLSKRDPNYDVLGGANFPDPSIIIVEGRTYAFGTNDGAGNKVPYTSNEDFSNPSGWSQVRDSFPRDGVPAFGDDGWAADPIWAPDVNRLVRPWRHIAFALTNALLRHNLTTALLCIMQLP